MVCIGSGADGDDVLAGARAAGELAARHTGYIWHTAGVHPHDASGFDVLAHPDMLREHAARGAVAIGECGLDYHYDNSPRLEQRRAFAAQLALAGEARLPVVVHTRDAAEDTGAMIEEAGSAAIIGVLHCFTGPASLAELALRCGWYVSFSGIVTFPRWADDELIRLVPGDRILAESDAPYLAPAPNRGRRNEPAWVANTVRKLAAASGTDPETMGSLVTENARRLFKLAPALPQ